VGIIDKEFNRYPIFNKILATCRQQPTLEEYRTGVETFPDFLDIMGINKLLNKLSQILLCTIRTDRVFLIAVCEHSKAAAGRLEKP